MKKYEILKLIEANEIIKKNSALLSIAKHKSFNKFPIDKKYWFPNIEELKQEFDILGEEVQSALDETRNCIKYIQNSGCDHEVRLKYFGLFWDHSCCVLCGKTVASDGCVDWEYSINRNKYCVDLISKYQADEDYGHVSCGYTNEQVYEIIMNILKDKKDDEEIDLVQEFKKLNLQECEINEEKKITENYILIIGGSNKQFVDTESYLYKKRLKIGLDFIKYFSGLLNTKVELVDNSETLESSDFKKMFPKDNCNLKFIHYNTIEELERILSRQKGIPFKIIIDLSELYEYKICDNAITKEALTLKLSEYFPNSHFIKIGNLSKRSLKELSEFLKNIQNFDNLYAYRDDVYYYLEKDKVTSDNLENTCRKIKRLLRK